MTNILLHRKFERHCKHKMLISSTEHVHIVSLSSTSLSSIRLHLLEFISCSSNENSNNYILVKKQTNKTTTTTKKVHGFVNNLHEHQNTSFQNTELFQTGIECTRVLTFKNYSINLVTKRQNQDRRKTYKKLPLTEKL